MPQIKAQRTVETIPNIMQFCPADFSSELSLDNKIAPKIYPISGMRKLITYLNVLLSPTTSVSKSLSCFS